MATCLISTRFAEQKAMGKRIVEDIQFESLLADIFIQESRNIGSKVVWTAFAAVNTVSQTLEDEQSIARGRFGPLMVLKP